MAPIRNRSQAGGGVGKKVHRKTRPAVKEPSDSWNLLERQGLNPTANDEEMEDQDMEQTLAIDGSAGVDEAVTPLREMAERVGKEVETFAETLDDFLTHLPTSSATFDAAHDLVLNFKNIADEKVEELKKSHERETRDQLRREWSQQARFPAASGTFDPFTSTGSAAMSAKKAEQVRQLRQWQQEADIWELFRIMLELHPFEADAQADRADREEKLAKLGEPNRYTSEGDLWVRFLAEDNLGNERYKIKTWLEQTANHQASDVQSIVEELETKAGRGKGLWSSSWMHTRERIKGEKRLRAWPNASDSPLPQIRRSDNNELLVTTLDPDAPHRQQRTLEKDDSYFERAIWVACWEMLRRGKPPQEICNWCEDRKEGWRAVCMGKAFDNTEPATSSMAWRQMCQVASQSGCSTDYEAAVFGLLGGNIKAVEKVCHTIDDHLYAYYSATLLRQFDQYVLSIYPDKARPSLGRHNLVDDSALDPESAQSSISDLVARLRRNASTSSESVQPMKIIQSFLLADEVGSLIHTVGAAIAEAAALQEQDDDLYFRDPAALGSAKPRDEIQVAIDMQTLRIVTHMSIIHRVLSPDYLTGEELLEDENVMIAYIQALRAAGKRSIIPTYASKLRQQKYVVVLARILQDITDEREQREIIGLLHHEGLDTVAILNEQLSFILETTFSGESVEKPLRILESTDETKLHPGQRIIVDFLPDLVSDSEETLGRCLEWFKLLPGNWKVTFEALTVALRRCLVTGRFACARMITQNFPYHVMSSEKFYDIFKRSVNIMDAGGELPGSEQEAMTWSLMKRQSRTYNELQQLVHAVEALFTWRVEEHKLLSKVQKASSPPSVLKRARENVFDSMEPLLRGILLNPIDEAEAEDLARIRLAYLPEVILAYNTVLHAAGNLITRDALLESMDLSTIVATGTVGDDESATAAENNGLAECFAKAGRMRELVSSFALTSKLMLVLKAEGKPWKAKKDRQGKDLGLWELQGN